MSEKISLVGLDKSLVLVILYFYAGAPGLGDLNRGPDFITFEEAQKILNAPSPDGTYIDHIHGRALHVDLSGDDFDPEYYDRETFFTAAESIATLRKDPERAKAIFTAAIEAKAAEQGSQ